MDWRQIRGLFPATEGLAYLNTATYGPAPRPVVEAIERGLAEWSSGRGDWLAWERAAESARRRFARLIGSRPEEVALVPAVSLAAAQVAERLPFRPGASIVLGEGEFRSNLYPWLLQERRGFQLRLVPFRQGRLILSDLLEAVDRGTALVAVSSVQSASGHRIPLQDLAEACGARGVRLFVDGTQHVGALRLPLEGIDFLAVAGYKWLLTPRGAAFLYVAAHRWEEVLPLCPGWKTPADPHADYYGPPLDLAPRASRYDLSLAWHAWLGADEALRLILDVGAERIEARDLELAGRLWQGLQSLGLHRPYPAQECSQVVAVRVPDPEAVRTELERARVTAAVRGGNLRFSPHFFNDQADVERAIGALERALSCP